MFRCDVCGFVAPLNTRSSRLVIETRPADYPARERAYLKPPARRRKGKDKWIADPGGRGTQIVRELRACEPCAARTSAIDRPSAAAIEAQAEPREARPTTRSEQRASRPPEPLVAAP